MNTSPKTEKTFKNPYRISVQQLVEDFGYDTTEEFLTAECNDSVVPACCKEARCQAVRMYRA